jgi:hypothetical protein
MSFLQRSDLKKHLSTRAGDLPRHIEPQPAEAARVILRDGNLITLPSSVLKEETVDTPEIEQA